MNLNKKIPAAIALASCLLLPSCDFNEDFCTRYGELIAYCDWENITEKAPLPPLRHVIPFQGNASIKKQRHSRKTPCAGSFREGITALSSTQVITK